MLCGNQMNIVGVRIPGKDEWCYSRQLQYSTSRRRQIHCDKAGEPDKVNIQCVWRLGHVGVDVFDALLFYRCMRDMQSRREHNDFHLHP